MQVANTNSPALRYTVTGLTKTTAYAFEVRFSAFARVPHFPMLRAQVAAINSLGQGSFGSSTGFFYTLSQGE